MKGQRFPSMIAHIAKGIRQGSSQIVAKGIARNLKAQPCLEHQSFFQSAIQKFIRSSPAAEDFAIANISQSIKSNKKHDKNNNYDPNFSIGILQIDYEYPAALGDVCHPDSFGHDVFYEKIKGLSFQKCQDSYLTPEIEEQIEIAVQKLEAKGVIAITGDCGFLHPYQDTVLNYSQVPVFMSSLIQLPLVEASLRKDEKIAILTANCKTFNQSLLPNLGQCALDPEGCRQKYEIVGCQDIDGFEAVALGEKVDVNKVMRGITELTQNLIKKDPKIKAFLFECTELPPYSNQVRKVTGLPVFDALTTIETFCISKKSNARVVHEEDVNPSRETESAYVNSVLAEKLVI